MWALLRGLEGEPAGLSIDDVAGRAVISAGVAARYLQRLSTRHPALVAPVATGARRAYALTPAGRVELARLERRIPGAREHAHAAPPL